MSDPIISYNGKSYNLPMDEENILTTIREAPDELLIAESQRRGYIVTKQE